MMIGGGCGSCGASGSAAAFATGRSGTAGTGAIFNDGKGYLLRIHCRLGWGNRVRQICVCVFLFPTK